MTMDTYLTLPCQYCGQYRKQHVGRAFVCFGGMGTLWHPKESILDDNPFATPAAHQPEDSKG